MDSQGIVRKVKPRKNKCIKGERNLRIREGDIVTWLKKRNCKNINKKYVMTRDEFNVRKEALEEELQYLKDTQEINNEGPTGSLSFFPILQRHISPRADGSNKKLLSITNQDSSLAKSSARSPEGRYFSPINRYNKDFIERSSLKRKEILRKIQHSQTKLSTNDEQTEKDLTIPNLNKVSPEAQEKISRPFITQKKSYIQLFKSYASLGFTKRKKRMRIFQQNLQNKILDKKLRKLREIIRSPRKPNIKFDVKDGSEPNDSPLLPTSADSASNDIKLTLRTCLTDHPKGRREQILDRYSRFIDTNASSGIL
ncbi:unnamed protein product [Moneuplotes crassus]|uniref:Uncharacterized protein n=1 Tax=Euplotes crassus TaxID=5936 RepID=A0AAD1Y7M0_EUPCR|nr:unnamed protein product [Moneuplotes crassus]